MIKDLVQQDTCGNKSEETKSVKVDSFFKESLDLKQYLDDYGIVVKSIKPHGSSILYVLDNCLFDLSHKGGESAIVPDIRRQTFIPVLPITAVRDTLGTMPV